MTFLPSTSDRTRRRLAWAAPLAVAGVVAGVVASTSGSASGASPQLPHRSPAQLLADVQTSTATAFSGSVRETADLGLPTLPGGHSDASLSWQTFLSGTHTARVWVDGTDKQRLALVRDLSEADVVHNGTDLWTYTSDTNTVTHSTLRTPGTSDETPSVTDLSPAAAARRLLAAVSPTTKVSVDAAQQVAGRDAYTLVVVPRDTRSTVRRIAIAVDAATSVPLRVQIFGSGTSPAFTTGFTSISFTPPSASTFTFSAPKGATRSTDPLGVATSHHRGGAARPSAKGSGATSPTPTSAKPTVTGAGWTSVLELNGSDATGLGGSTIRDLTTAVGTSGARLLRTTLLNAVILPDGRTFVGAVSPALLEHVAATTAR